MRWITNATYAKKQIKEMKSLFVINVQYMPAILSVIQD